MSEFTCDRCNETFNRGWTEEEAKKEFDTAPWNIPGEDIGILCDDCFEGFKIWFDSLTEEDHKRMRGI